MSEKITLLDRWEICRMLGDSEHEWKGQMKAILCIGWKIVWLADGTLRSPGPAAGEEDAGSALINFTYEELVLFSRAIRRERTAAERFLHKVFPLNAAKKHPSPPLYADPEQIADIPKARLSGEPRATDINCFRLTLHNIGESEDHVHYVGRLELFTIADYIKGWLAPEVDY